MIASIKFKWKTTVFVLKWWGEPIRSFAKQRPWYKIDRPPPNLKFPSKIWLYKKLKENQSIHSRKAATRGRLMMEKLDSDIVRLVELQRQALDVPQEHSRPQNIEEKIFHLCRDQLGLEMKEDDLICIQRRLQFLLCHLEMDPEEMDFVVHKEPRWMLPSSEIHFLSMMRFYKQLGFCGASLGRLFVRCPELGLVSIPHDMKLKFRYLDSVGMSKNVVVELLKEQPKMFTVPFEFDFKRKLDFLLNAGLTLNAIVSLLKHSDQILFCSVENNIVPKMRFFQSRGFDRIAFSHLVVKYPFLYAMDLQHVMLPFFKDWDQRLKK